MSELEARIRAKLKLNPNAAGIPPMPPRWPRIRDHYEQRIAKGMKLSYAVDQAFCNLSGSNRHDTPRSKAPIDFVEA
jgi:hypothetical protein